jgi:hypothetical protein
MGRQRRRTPPLVPEWDDPVLTRLARRLRDAHRRVAGLPAAGRKRLTRQLLIITDLAKRDPRLALHRLEGFLADLDRDLDKGADSSQ